jgi:hypothetical protein
MYNLYGGIEWDTTKVIDNKGFETDNTYLQS